VSNCVAVYREGESTLGNQCLPWSQPWAAAAAGNPQSTRRISSWYSSIFPLSVGPHTFNMQYESGSGTANFSANYLKVQPL
jgi:hypothetical protein